MTKKTQTIALYFSVIIMAIASIFWVNGLILAWTAPTAVPPGSNVAAPLNVGSTGQSKAGGLILNTGGATTGLIVDSGNVGIGTAAPGAKLHVAGTAGVDGIMFPDGTLQTTAGGGSSSGGTYNAVTDMTSEVTYHHTLALMSDGTVKSWGYNGQYQLGIGVNTGNMLLPVTVPLPGGAISLADGFYGGYALLENGQVWGWGYNNYGNLGDGTTTQRPVPVRAGSLTGVIKILTSQSQQEAYSVYALKSDGTVWSWGYNGYGQLGDGSVTVRTSPVQVSGLTNVVDVEASNGPYGSPCALKSDGTVWCWGYNGYGQLGDGSTTQRNTPVQVSGLTNVISIESTGGDAPSHNCALKSDGTVWSWGYNGYGQLGDGSTTNRYTPVQVSGLTNVKSIFLGGGQHGSSYAILNDGTVRSWGYNGYGQLGDGSVTVRTTPVNPGLTNVKQMAIAGRGSYSTTCALLNDGTAKCMGYYGYGQVGVGDTTPKYTPTTVAGLKNAQKIWAKGSSNMTYFCVLLDSGALKCWGYNGNGQLGIGNVAPVYTPQYVKTLNLD